jgi:hypothetical protein
MVCFATGTTVALPVAAAAGAGCAAGAGVEYVAFETWERRGRAGSERTIAQRIGEDKFRFFMEIVFGLFKSKALGGESLANSVLSGTTWWSRRWLPEEFSEPDRGEAARLS